MAEKKTKKTNKKVANPAEKSEETLSKAAETANQAVDDIQDGAKKSKKDKPEDRLAEKNDFNIFDMTSQVDTYDSEIEDMDLCSNLIETQNSVKVMSGNSTHQSKDKKVEAVVEHRKINGNGNSPDDDQPDEIHRYVIPNTIGIMALRNIVLFPGIVVPLGVGRSQSQALLDDLTKQQGSEKVFGVITQIDQDTDSPGFDDVYATGTIVAVLKTINMPDGNKTVVVHGLMRFKVKKWISSEPFLQAEIEPLPPEKGNSSLEVEAQVNSIKNMAERILQLSPNIPEEVHVIMQNIDDPGPLADFLAGNIHFSQEEKQGVLEAIDIKERLNKLSVSMANQLEMLELSEKIQSKVHQAIDKNQREYFLQEQLKAIQKELGQDEGRSAEVIELEERIREACMPEEVEFEAVRELQRLSQIPVMSPEFSVLSNYLEWLCELPWNVTTEDNLNIARARRILNADHFGLKNVKKRILEFLAVRKLNPEGRSPILCFAGPPGVGKTSLGRSIARSMGRKFIRMSLGGIRDEADIRGHRRTYIGSLPGRIIQEIRKCGSNNPVFMLDELDKIGNDFRGDPASALLEVLDPQQNNTFTDHFIEQPFDLSKVMFIGTANYMEAVPHALKDRLEVIEIPGYTASEKLNIGRKYLAPRQMIENGLTEKTFSLKDEALQNIIDNYTREAGVRNLEREIATVCRSVAAEIAEGKRKSATIGVRHLNDILGPTKYESELALRTSTPGVATGLAYTPVGGEILFIESTLLPGKGQLILTGQLGDVMKESARAALSVLKSMALETKTRRATPFAELKEVLSDIKTMDQRDIHIHVPAGAVPKDGPSAGLAMFTSMASLLTGIPVKSDVAMTGEITLRGLAMPIGGLKEKLLAAREAGIKMVILPERNKKDLVDVPKEVTKSLKFNFVRNADQVLKIALEL